MGINPDYMTVNSGYCRQKPPVGNRKSVVDWISQVIYPALGILGVTYQLYLLLFV